MSKFKTSDIEALFADVSNEVLHLVAYVETHNFAQTFPEDKKIFHNAVLSFLQQVTTGKQRFLEYLPTALNEKYLYNQKIYKETAKYQRRFSLIEKFLPASGKILDYGTGDGGLAQFLSKQTELEIHAADVIDWRKDSVSEKISFHHINVSNNKLSVPDEYFDLVILVYVLHHVSAVDFCSVMKEILRIAQRIVLVEEVFDIRDEMLLSHDDVSARFVKLSASEQEQFTKIRDWFRNIAVLGMTDMSMPFQFRTVSRWINVLQHHGFNPKAVNVMGFEASKTWSHTACNSVFYFEKR